MASRRSGVRGVRLDAADFLADDHRGGAARDVARHLPRRCGAVHHAATVVAFVLVVALAVSMPALLRAMPADGLPTVGPPRTRRSPLSSPTEPP